MIYETHIIIKRYIKLQLIITSEIGEKSPKKQQKKIKRLINKQSLKLKQKQQKKIKQHSIQSFSFRKCTEKKLVELVKTLIQKIFQFGKSANKKKNDICFQKTKKIFITLNQISSKIR